MFLQGCVPRSGICDTAYSTLNPACVVVTQVTWVRARLLLIFSENVPNDSGTWLTGAAWSAVPPVRNVFLMLKLNLQALVCTVVYGQSEVTLNTREEEIRRPASQIGW